MAELYGDQGGSGGNYGGQNGGPGSNYGGSAGGSGDNYGGQNGGSGGNYGGNPAGGFGAGMGAPVQYAKAAPEDLQKVKAQWKNIVAGTTGMFRVVLSAAEPKFNAQDPNDGRLFVVFADFLAERYLNNIDRRHELEQIIAEKTGKQVEVKFVLAADEGIQRGSLSKIEIEERIHEFIHTDIEIEDEV